MISRSDVLWPLTGLRYFLTHPRNWPRVLLANFLGNTGIAIISIAILWWYWPDNGIQSFESFLRLMQQWLMSLAAALIFLAPLMKTRSGMAVLKPLLIELGHDISPAARPRGLVGRNIYFLRTIMLRIAWILIFITAHRHHSVLGLIAGMWGIGHLVLLDSCDQVLILFDESQKSRKIKLKAKSADILIAGGIAGLMLAILGSTAIAWLIWIPGCVCGAAMWINGWYTKEDSVARKPDSTTNGRC